MPNALDSIVAHLAGQRDPLELLAEALRRLTPEQRAAVLAQFCPRCRGFRGRDWWNKEGCERCSGGRIVG